MHRSWGEVSQADLCAIGTGKLQNSLFPLEISLFLEIFSLLISVGNLTKSDCSAAVSYPEIRSQGPSGDLWITEFVLSYDGVPSYAVSITEFREEMVANETQYFADRFDPAPSRTHLVERVGEITSRSGHLPGSAHLPSAKERKWHKTESVVTDNAMAEMESVRGLIRKDDNWCQFAH